MGSVLTSNILKANREVVCRTLVRHLTPDKMQLTGSTKQVANFDANITLKLHNAATEADFGQSVLTPVYDTYTPHTTVYDGEVTKCLLRLLRR